MFGEPSIGIFSQMGHSSGMKVRTAVKIQSAIFLRNLCLSIDYIDPSVIPHTWHIFPIYIAFLWVYFKYEKIQSRKKTIFFASRTCILRERWYSICIQNAGRKCVAFFAPDHFWTGRDVAQSGLARLTGGQKVVSSNLIVPTIFFALSFPVLTDRIFLCLDFTHRISSIYSNIIAPTENKQRTEKSLFSDIFLRILR